jgi:hypothetical protein
MSYYFPVPYSGAAPGADSNTYVLLDTTDVEGVGPVRPQNFRRYLLSLNNSQAGTLKVFGSDDAGATWKQIYDHDTAAATTEHNNDFAIPTLPHADVRAEWENGGVAQATFDVAQALDDGIAASRPTFVDPAGDSDGGESTTVDSPQFPSSLGQKTMAQSLAIVVASNQSAVPVSATQLPAALGQTTKSASLPVTLASNQDALPITDNSGSLTVDSPQIPSALGAQTAATSLSVVKATAAVTDNTAYIVNGDMSASITSGATIALGPEGKLEVYASWDVGTPVGRLKLMGRAPDGTTFFEIPNQALGWHVQPAGTTGSTGGLFRELAPISHVRIDYERTSSGSAAALDVQTRVS